MTDSINEIMSKIKPEGNNGVADFISALFYSEIFTHQMHLQTRGAGAYAAHKALEGYYTEIGDLIDSIVEVYQGRTGSIITGYKCNMSNTNMPLDYMKSLRDYVDNNRKVMGQYSHIQNLIDEVVELIDSTIYKLTFLQ